MYNLASGCPLPEEATYFLLKNKNKGYSVTSQKVCTSVKSKLQSSLTLLRGYLGKDFTMPRKRPQLLQNGKLKMSLFRETFDSWSSNGSIIKKGAAVDLDKALSYSLSPVPLALEASDGLRGKTCKSKLTDAALSSIVTDNVNTDHAACLVIDLIATIRCIAKVPNTFRELALQLLHQIPSMYQTVYAACDTYLERSIKSSDREIRGQAETFVIRSPDIRIPPDF